MKKSLLVLALLCLTVSNAQKKKDSKIVTVIRTTADYDQISVNGSFDVKLISGKEGSIIINADEKLLPFIKTDVKDGTLSVYVDTGKNRQFSYNSVIEVTIPFEEIDRLTCAGSGSVSTIDRIESENFDLIKSGSGSLSLESATSNLQVTKSGSGALTVKGKTGSLKVNCSGSGNTNLTDLLSQNATADQSGSGSMHLYCTKVLIANSHGSGSIQYRGKPVRVEKNSVGSGSITGS